MEMELRTYNIRDSSGLLAFSTDDLQDAARFLTENPGHHPDDLKTNDLRGLAKAEREAAKEVERATVEREKEREKLIEDRVQELTADPEILATAVAEIEHRLGVV